MPWCHRGCYRCCIYQFGCHQRAARRHVCFALAGVGQKRGAYGYAHLYLIAQVPRSHLWARQQPDHLVLTAYPSACEGKTMHATLRSENAADGLWLQDAASELSWRRLRPWLSVKPVLERLRSSFSWSAFLQSWLSERTTKKEVSAVKRCSHLIREP